MEQKIEFRQVRDFGEIINDTFVFLKQLGKPLLKSIIMICGIIVLAQGLASVLYKIKVGSALGGGMPAVSSVFGWEWFISLVIGLISYTMIALTTLSFIHLYKEKGNDAPTTLEVWLWVKTYLFSFTFISLLLSMITIFGFMLCFIPGFYLWPVLSLVFPIMLIEGASFGYSFNKSFRLIKGNWWPTFGVQVIMFFLMYAVFFILSIPALIVNGVDIFLKPEASMSVGNFFTTFLSVFGYIGLILPTIGITFSYYSMIEQKDGTGLIDRINNLGTQAGPESQLPSEEY